MVLLFSVEWHLCLLITVNLLHIIKIQDSNDDGYIPLLYLIIMIIVTVEEIRTKGNSKQTKSHIGLHRKIYEIGEEKDIPI